MSDLCNAYCFPGDNLRGRHEMVGFQWVLHRGRRQIRRAERSKVACDFVRVPGRVEAIPTAFTETTHDRAKSVESIDVDSE
jgi:hypothetical protein